MAWMSLPVGVVTLAERFGGHDITPQSYASMVNEVTGHLAGLRVPMAAISTECTFSAPRAR